MSMARVTEWRKLPLSLAELCIDTTLRCGQSFRWRKINDEWCCTLYGRIVSLKQDPTHLHYKVTWPVKPIYPLTPPVTDGEIKGFAAALFESQAGPQVFVHKLCTHYGPLIGHVGDEPFHDFPTPEALTGNSVEAHLRELGFGYRAKYIAQTASIIVNDRPKGWFESLTNPENPCYIKTPEGSQLTRCTYKEAHEQLLQLAGVGPKVADCVCLMGLGWGEAVPVDTHVWQIAQRDYKFGKNKTKTFNKTMYDAVGDHFRELWGKYAGWAHSVLFTADLKTFSERTVKKEDQMVTVKKEVTLDEDASVLGKKRKVVKAKLKIEVDHEVPESAPIESSPKRRRTRSQTQRKT
ncbi:n-glycosylase DNA lyase [Colletotrichum incanum]|nr:n-glycosylase DNA lyase [Colletotrichum incanum]